METTNLSISFGIDVDDVVSSVVVPAVDKDSVQLVVGRIAWIRALQVTVQFQSLRKFKPIK